MKRIPFKNDSNFMQIWFNLTNVWSVLGSTSSYFFRMMHYKNNKQILEQHSKLLNWKTFLIKVLQKHEQTLERLVYLVCAHVVLWKFNQLKL